MLKTQCASQQRDALERHILELLPAEPPGLAVRKVHDRVALWSPSYIGQILRRLESEHKLSSCRIAGEHHGCLPRHFWRTAAL